MDTPGLTLLVAVVVALGCLLALLATQRRSRAEQRRLGDQLRASTTAVADLRGLVEELAGRMAVADQRPPGAPRDGFVITSLPGEPGVEVVTEQASRDVEVLPLSGRDFATVAVTESTVRLVSLAHGVRRALSAENRNRIRFEVRREVRRSRRQRRRDLKEARRHLRVHGAPAGRDAA